MANEPVGYSLSEIQAEILSLQTLREEVDQRIRDLNVILEDVSYKLNQIRGLSSLTPEFFNHLDVGGKRVTNGSRSQKPTDFVIRKELEDAGIFNPNPARTLDVKRPIKADGGISIGGSLVLTEEEITNLIIDLLGENVAVIQDGEVIDLQDYDGTTGTTQGTLIFGATLEDGTRARLVRVNPAGDMLVADPSTREQLSTITHLLEKLIQVVEDKS